MNQNSPDLSLPVTVPVTAVVRGEMIQCGLRRFVTDDARNLRPLDLYLADRCTLDAGGSWGSRVRFAA